MNELKFYYTYGTDSRFPFRGGWTEVTAPSRDIADQVFMAVHPPRDESQFLNCSFVYGEESFRKTAMHQDGNYGKRCHERICITVTPVTEQEETR